ncbi:MAG: zinc ribbon domain-containing protein [Lentisphaerae bacterium]|jgi:putative FmdB family regulatory protein|nr:zinc ribbon domain-containing protein [Lentisphaerota bacterium]
MPTYEYKCEQCGDRFDHFQSMSSEPLKSCKKCGGKLRRLIGCGAGIIFKGSGFYCTDYKKSGANAAAAPAPNADSTSSNSKDSGGKDSCDTKKNSVAT